jgi:hypothetical protein
MTALARFAQTWPMLSALGAGLVFLALAAGATGVAGIALAVVGIAALGWGVLSLRVGAATAPYAVLGVSAALLVGAGALIGAGLVESTDVAVGPLVAASVFTAVVGGHCALLVRRGARGARSDRAARPLTAARLDPAVRSAPTRAVAAAAADAGTSPARAGRPFSARATEAVADRTSLAGLVAGAILVAALATPALAATEAGGLAVPHGEHGGSTSVTDADPGQDGHRH